MFYLLKRCNTIDWTALSECNDVDADANRTYRRCVIYNILTKRIDLIIAHIAETLCPIVDQIDSKLLSELLVTNLGYTFHTRDAQNVLSIL